ncbi:MAG: CoA transferase [Acidimicrobiia bacterium]|nr:MAG: CoA transferase [Acidimicrobiia bacterium]
MAGPLSGIRVVELAGIGPGPFCGMVLADHGAEVVVVDRPGESLLPALCRRGKKSIVVDLKRAEGVEVVLDLVAGADVLLEGYRPGVAERLGVGPDECLTRNPRLVYARVTGWGQEGPRAARAGHDIDYIAVTGALHAIGDEQPVPPLNLLGDYGGGGMLAAFGIAAALVEVMATGRGQVIDVAMVDGASLLMQPIYEMLAAGLWQDRRAANLLDGGAPFYGVYRTSDGRWLAVGALEEPFYREFCHRLGLDPGMIPAREDPGNWPRLRGLFAERFAGKSLAEWMEVFEGSDACVAPVLSLGEAPQDPHNLARDTFMEVGGVLQPGPAPRFGNHGRPQPGAFPLPGGDTREILAQLGYGREAVDRLVGEGVVRPAEEVP